MTRSDADLYAALDLDARARRTVAIRVHPRRALHLRPALAAAAALVLVVVAGAQFASQRLASTTPSPAMQRLALYPSSDGTPWLTMPLPDGWSVAQKPEAAAGRGGGGRAQLIANVAIDQYVTGKAYPGQLDWASLPRDAVVVEVRDICGGVVCVHASDETSFPLRWSDAQPLTAGGPGTPIPIPSGFDARQILLRYFDEGHVLITYVGDQATAHDRALVDAVVSGIAPAPLPASGVIHDRWLALGAFAALPSDTPMFAPLPKQASLAPADYVVMRHGSDLIAHPMLEQLGPQWCTLSWDAASATYACPGRTERFDRYGRAMTPKTEDLEQFPTLIRDGKAFLNFGTLNGGPITLSPSVAAPAACSVGTGGLQVCPGAGPVGTVVTLTDTGWGCTPGHAGAAAILVFEGHPESGAPTEGGQSLPDIQPDASGAFTTTFTIPATLDSFHGQGGGPTKAGTYSFVGRPPDCMASFEVTDK